MKEQPLRISFWVPVCLILTVFLSSCYPLKTPLQGGGSGFIREEFLDTRRLVILPFEGDETGEVLDTFFLTFRKAFPNIEVIDRRKLRGLFQQEDLHLGQLEDAVRKKIGKELDAEALVIGSVHYPSITRWLLQIKIVDAETGDILGRSLAEVDYMGAWGVREGCELAVQNLRPR
jgi:hypothetical protein